MSIYIITNNTKYSQVFVFTVILVNVSYIVTVYLHNAFTRLHVISTIKTDQLIYSSCISTSTDTCKYHILYEEVDESHVNVLDIVSYSSPESTVDQYRYPRPGD